MDLIDTISKHLSISKEEAEEQVRKAHPEVHLITHKQEEEPILLTDEVEVKTFHPTILDHGAKKPLLIEHRPLDEHQENVDYYLAGQPDHSEEAEIAVFGQAEVDAMRKAAAEECLPLLNTFLTRDQHLPVEEIERRAKAIVAARVINADYDNTFDINHCVAISCNKAVDGCCMAYRNPIVLNWFRHGNNCPTGPYQASAMEAHAKLAKKINPLKASKRNSK